MKESELTNGTYTVPVSGIYKIEAEFISIPENNFEYRAVKYTPSYKMIKNPKKKWYTFWRPKTIKIDMGGTYEYLDSSNIIFLKKDQQISVEGVSSIGRVK